MLTSTIRILGLLLRLSAFDGNCKVVDTFEEGVALSCIAGDPASDCSRDIAVNVYSDFSSEEP
jgi:hypothetical protein